ncbi:armadillo-type protein [Pilaira anomala]|nr:armadillo-type protein [Pilaira anomala]
MTTVENKENLEKQVINFTKQLETIGQDEKAKATILLNRASVYESLNLPEKASQDARFALNLDSSLEPKVKPFLERQSPAPKPQDPRVESFQRHLSALEGADTAHIRSFVSSTDFVSVLTACGTVDTPPRVKSLAFMILTKLFNPSSSEKYPFTYIIEQCAACFAHCIDQGKNDAKLLAYNTLIAIFQTSMTVGSAILCQEGTVEEMMDVVEFETLPVQLAVAQLLTIASSDKSCRKQILKYAVNWLVNMAGRSKTDPQLKAAAGTALTKLKAQPDDDETVKKEEEQPVESLEETMKRMHLTNESLVDSLQHIIKSKSSDASLLLNAVEGLAYACLKPEIKDKLGKDPEFLKCLSTLALSTTNHADANSNPLLFGIGTIFSNLTMYRPVMDEQQKQMKKLRDLANAKQQQAAGGPAKEDENDPRENDDAVEARIKLCIQNGAALALMVLSKNTSVNLRAVAAQTYFNLVTPQSVRGQLLQQGIVKALLPLSRSDIVASQALAKLAITADPRLAFQGDMVLDLVRPFLELCKDTTSQLRQFEGLMALTNLASVDDRVRLMIEDADGMSVFENLQLSNNDMVQRAATEMVCNMTFCDPVFERYSDPERSQNRIRLLMILSDSEDPATRRAASGALAILANSPGTCDMILKVDKCYERIARWVEPEETVDVQHRGVEIIRCLIAHKKDVVADLVKEHVDKKLVLLVKNCQVQVVRSAAMEVLKLFVENGVKLQA